MALERTLSDSVPMLLEDAVVFDEVCTLLLKCSKMRIRQLSCDDMAAELTILKCLPEARQPISWDSEMSVLVHTTINCIENTLHSLKHTGSAYKLPSLARVTSIIKLLHPGMISKKIDTCERKALQQVSFLVCEAQIPSVFVRSCKAKDAKSMRMLDQAPRMRSR